MHEILDDQKSVLYLLMWSALYYTSYSSQDDMGPHMKSYDEINVYCNGNVKGGFCKKLMIWKPLEVIFYSLTLYELIDRLCGWFCERYSMLRRNASTFSENSDAESTKIFDAIEAYYHRQCGKIQRHAILVHIFWQKLASGD